MDATAASATGTGVVVGSPGYMSPEQVLARPVGPPSDVFALGAVLAYAATGRGPFRGDSAAVLLYKVAHEEPELDGMPDGLREVAEACLAKNPSVRPTPAEIARRFAPGGAAALVREGWLPSSLTGQLAARAVELLDLEAVAPQEDAAPAGFGPAPTDFAPMPAVPESAPARRRRAAVTWAAVVTGAAAAGLAVWLMPDGGAGGVEDSKATASASASAIGTATIGAIPAAFLGTWEGTVVQRDGTPNGTMKVTITRGSKGHDVARTTYAALGLECHSRAALVSVTQTRLTVAERGDDQDSSLLCTDSPATVTFTTSGSGTLTYTSDDEAGGTPHARLTKTGG